MPFVTLIASPERRNLDPAMVESLRNAWGGGAAIWLAPDEAAEFEISEVPSNRWQVWHDLQTLEVDLALQADRGPKRVLLADMDSTLIQQECIDELADEAGAGAKVAAITARAMNGELEFVEALRARVSLLRGLNADVIARVLERRITHASGAKTLVATMKMNGAHTVLVSGGFTAFADPVAAALCIDEARANRLIIEDGSLSGEVADPVLGRDAKVVALREVAAGQGVGVGQVLAVGDGANDLGMLKLAGAGVAMHAKPAVAAECELRINFGDLTALLYLQGYAREEFAD